MLHVNKTSMKTFINSLLYTVVRGSSALVVASMLTLPAFNVHAGQQPSLPVKFAVLSDLHYYDTRLGTSGAAFEAYLDQDPKLLKESGAILDAAIARILQQGVKFVIVSGDLTKDGEILNHVRVAQHFAKLEKRGVEVFVVPGNHDINNADAVSYRPNSTRRVPSASPNVFRALYQQFGYRQAIARDKNSLSYVAEPVKGVWLLAIDSCKYEESARVGYPVVSGRIKPATLLWVQARLQEAQKRGKKVIAFTHHGVNLHFAGEAQLFPDYLLDDWAQVGARLAGAGLKLVFTGHYHSQDAAYILDINGTPQPASLCDVETGSLSGYPCAFRLARLSADGTLQIKSERVEEIAADTGGVPFQQYAEAAMRARLPGLVTQQLMALLGISQAEASYVAPLVCEALIANYAGDEAPTAAMQDVLNGLVGNPDPMHTLGLMLWGIWTDLPPSDNALTLSLGGS